MSIGSASPQRRWGPSAAAVLALILAVMLPTKREPGNDLPSPNMQTSIFEDLTLTVIPSRPRIL